jgi:hypothetical protein
VAARTYFTWSSYLDPLRKARRDLARLNERIPSTDADYMDEVYSLVLTTNNVGEWVKHHSDQGKTASEKMYQARRDDPSHPVQVMRDLCNGLKHAEPWTDTPEATVVATRSKKTRVRGREPSGLRSPTNPMRVRGGGSRISYVVKVAGERLSVVLVAAQALEAWDAVLAEHGLPAA